MPPTFGCATSTASCSALKQGLLLRNDGDQHVMVIGSPGQGKSRGFVIPTMMSFQGVAGRARHERRALRGNLGLSGRTKATNFPAGAGIEIYRRL
ncbi:type IV secretory system conjugative DNA transfer family protein [Rhizobium beringeri]